MVPGAFSRDRKSFDPRSHWLGPNLTRFAWDPHVIWTEIMWDLPQDPVRSGKAGGDFFLQLVTHTDYPVMSKAWDSTQGAFLCVQMSQLPGSLPLPAPVSITSHIMTVRDLEARPYLLQCSVLTTISEWCLWALWNYGFSQDSSNRSVQALAVMLHRHQG